MECFKEMLDKNLVRRVLETGGRKRDSAVGGREVSEKSYIYIYNIYLYIHTHIYIYIYIYYRDILRVGEKCSRVEK